MNRHLKFWVLAALYVIITLPFVVAGFIYNAAEEEFKNGRRKHRSFTYFMTRLWKKINPNYYTSK
jgi:hypothetical protein